MLFNLTQEVGELFGREHARLGGLAHRESSFLLITANNKFIVLIRI
ncbi:hypothetical protein F6453_0854 [Marinobacter nauticus]|uniref:Uncharacterized protein n=1 Tax=Marinobacter nauticus TaxID=2743 RepID=A0A833JRV0_MARNT|nr:hypothetical protein F6453_0854 [Marinobacter nauticus]